MAIQILGAHCTACRVPRVQVPPRSSTQDGHPSDDPHPERHLLAASQKGSQPLMPSTRPHDFPIQVLALNRQLPQALNPLPASNRRKTRDSKLNGLTQL